MIDVAAAGQERALVAVDVGERAEPVVFQLEEPSGWLNASGIRTNGMGRHTRDMGRGRA